MRKNVLNVLIPDDRHLIAIQSEKDGSGVFVVQRPQHGAALIACKPTSPEVEIKFRNKMSGEVVWIQISITLGTKIINWWLKLC